MQAGSRRAAAASVHPAALHLRRGERNRAEPMNERTASDIENDDDGFGGPGLQRLGKTRQQLSLQPGERLVENWRATQRSDQRAIVVTTAVYVRCLANRALSEIHLPGQDRSVHVSQRLRDFSQYVDYELCDA